MLGTYHICTQVKDVKCHYKLIPPSLGYVPKKKKKSHYKDKAHAKECHDYKLHICSQEKDGHYKDLSVAK